MLLFDPLDGSSNIDVNISVGSIFSVLKLPDGNDTVSYETVLHPGGAGLRRIRALGPVDDACAQLGPGRARLYP